MSEKRILLGNEAIARGAYEAGVKVSAAYPGTPSTEVSEALAKYDEVYAEWAPNEKVATEVAIGASISGVRSMCAMKHVGLNVAADPLYTAAYTGVRGGMVLVVADDPGMYSSQNEQDTRMVARAAMVPVVEPSDSSEAKEFMKDESIPNTLAVFKKHLEAVEYFTKENVQACIKATQKEAKVRGKMLYMPLRIATTGIMHGPDLASSICLLGKEKVLSRL